jgi:GxxExxY protein
MIENFPFKEETYDIIGLCMEVHKQLGHGFLELVYNDAIEWEAKTKDILYEGEKEFSIAYKEIILLHKFYADFILFENIILEVKAVDDGISNDFIAQVLNYLKASDCKFWSKQIRIQTSYLLNFILCIFRVHLCNLWLNKKFK